MPRVDGLTLAAPPTVDLTRSVATTPHSEARPSGPLSMFELMQLQQVADARYGELAAQAMEDSTGQPASATLTALLQEEGRLQRLLGMHDAQFREAAARLQQANTPDPQLGLYTNSLQDSVNAQVRARAAGEAAEVARASLEAAQQALQRETEIQRTQEARLYNAGTRAQLLMRDNTALQHEVQVVEARLARARSDHAQQSAAYRAGVAELQQGARVAESNLTSLEVEVSRLEAEVRWYRLRCGEDVALAASAARASELG